LKLKWFVWDGEFDGLGIVYPVGIASWLFLTGIPCFMGIYLF